MEIEAKLTYGEIAGLTLAVFLPLLGFIYSQIIQHNATRVELIATLRAGKVRSSYQMSVNWLLNWLHKIYGVKDGRRAFSVCLTMAYLYPIMFFVLAYSLFNGDHKFLIWQNFSGQKFKRLFGSFPQIEKVSYNR